MKKAVLNFNIDSSFSDSGFQERVIKSDSKPHHAVGND